MTTTMTKKKASKSKGPRRRAIYESATLADAGVPSKYQGSPEAAERGVEALMGNYCTEIPPESREDARNLLREFLLRADVLALCALSDLLKEHGSADCADPLCLANLCLATAARAARRSLEHSRSRRAKELLKRWRDADNAGRVLVNLELVAEYAARVKAAG